MGKRKLITMLLLLINVGILRAQVDSLAAHIDSLERVYQLDEVVITAKKKLFNRKPDRLVFNVENSIISTGGNALDALRITPGIKVQNDQISMIAKSGMVVMIDERPLPLSGESLINFLKGISTTGIQSIEIITTPPAKYKAEGNSGIINIVLKKNRSDSWFLTLRGTHQQATYSDDKIGADFNFKKNKLSVISNISAAYGKDLYTLNRWTYYPSETWYLTAPLQRNYKFANGNLGIDYEFNPYLLLGMNYYIHRTSNPFKKYELNTSILDIENNMSAYMNTSDDKKYDALTHVFNFHSIIKLDSLGKKITIDFDYINNNNNDSTSNYGRSFLPNNDIIPNSYYATISQNDGEVTNYSTKIDVMLPLNSINLNFGGQLDFTTNYNDYKFYDNASGVPIIDNNQTNIFKYKENVMAVYLSSYKDFNQKFSMQLGIRVENTRTEGYSQTVAQTDKNSYLNFFPSFYLLYRIKENNSLSLSYSKRINRPFFHDLNPFKTYVNKYDYTIGNPFLKPSYSNDIEASLTTGVFVHKLWYNYISDDYARFPIIDPETKVIERSPINFINYYSLGFSESYTFNKLDWWNSYNNLVFYYIRKNSTIPETPSKIDMVSGSFMSNNDFILNKKRTWMLNFGFYYELPYISSYSKVDSYHYFYMGLRTNLLNNRLSLALNVNDIFKTHRMRETLTSNNIKYINDNRWDSRYFQFSISYKIGNEFINIRKHSDANEKIRRRIK